MNNNNDVVGELIQEVVSLSIRINFAAAEGESLHPHLRDMMTALEQLNALGELDQEDEENN